MKKSAAQLLSVLILFGVSSPSLGQLEKTASEKSEVVTRLYESDDTQRAASPKQKTNYNPWTVHKKVALWGLAGSMSATLVGSLAMNDTHFATTVIPVVGPFITIVRIENDPNSFYRPGAKPLLIASGITQTAFLTYLTIAWIGETSYEGRNRSNLSVMPTGGRNGTGVALRYQF